MSESQSKPAPAPHLPATLLLLFGGLITAACATGEGPSGPQITGFESFGTEGDSEVVDTDGDTDGSMPEQGYLWCMEATNSSYEDGATVEPIYYAGTMDSPQGCVCAPQEVHEWLTDNAVSGEVDVSPSASLPQEIGLLRVFAYNEAESVCFSEAPDPVSFPNNCEDGLVEGGALDAAVVAGFQYPTLHLGDYDLETECVVSRFYVDGDYEPPGETCSFMTGSYSFTTSSNGTLEVDADLVEDILGQPGCLYSEAGRIALVGGDYEFTGIKSGDLLWELGIRNGDEPRTVNGSDVTTVDGAYDAWWALRSAKDFTLVVARGRGTTVLKFKLV